MERRRKGLTRRPGCDIVLRKIMMRAGENDVPLRGMMFAARMMCACRRMMFAAQMMRPSGMMCAAAHEAPPVGAAIRRPQYARGGIVERRGRRPAHGRARLQPGCVAQHGRGKPRPYGENVPFLSF